MLAPFHSECNCPLRKVLNVGVAEIPWAWAMENCLCVSICMKMIFV